MIHWLRIGVAGICLLAAACFVVLGMRSYSTKDVVHLGLESSPITRMSTARGRIVLSTKHSPYGSEWNWNCSRAGSAYQYVDDSGRSPSNRWFVVLRWSSFSEVHLPIWLLTTISGICGVVLVGRSRRISMRSLLLVTAVLAVVLGIGVVARHWPPPLDRPAAAGF